MKRINLFFIFIILFALGANNVFAADLSTDFINNAAFGDFSSRKYEPKVINLFRDKKEIKKKNKVKVEKYDSSQENINDVNLTDVDYIKKLKNQENKNVKKQFTINIKKSKEEKDKEVKEEAAKNEEIKTEEETEENAEEAKGDSDYVNESDSIVTVEPRNKKFFSKKKKKKGKKKEKEEIVQSDIILTADITDYYPDRNEIEAIGNAKLEMTGENFVLYADKIIFNHDINSVKAYENVKIVQEENVTTGDFINMDLNTAHGWIQKPLSSNYSLKVRAEEAYVYPDRIEEYEGVANILEDKKIAFGSSNFTNMLNPGQLDFGEFYKPKVEPTSLKIKAKDIIVNSEEGHNTIDIKQAGVYYKKFKLGVVPTLKILSDKENSVMETNIPEIGSDGNIGMYAGPSYVIGLPAASVLKLAPIVLYSKDEKKFGIGGIAKFNSRSNITEMAYGSAENKFMIRGNQNITNKLKINYSQNMYVTEWFLGFRRPKYALDLEYGDGYYIEDLDIKFRHRLQAGYYSDYARLGSNAKGRIRWMTQTQKTLFSYTNPQNTFSADFGLIGQTSVSQYTTGDTLGIVRFGPMLNTTYRNWTQSLIYYQSGVGGKTPFNFDDYVYGKSNIQFIETLRLNKYISIGYLMSIALNRDSYSTRNARVRDNNSNNKPFNWLQENMFLVSIGPDEAKLTFGYDAYRQTTALYFSMLLGTKDTDIAFKKTIINNPDNLSKGNGDETWIKRTFVKVKQTVFPATDPEYRTRLLEEQKRMREEALQKTEEEKEEDKENAEVQRQIIQQMKPFLNDQELMKDSRM